MNLHWSSHISIPIQNRLKVCSRYFTVFVFLTGVLVLLGWGFNIDWLKRPIPNLVAMNPATAIGFIFMAVAIWFILSNNRSKKNQRIAQGLSVLTFSIGLIKILSLFFTIKWRLDIILFQEKLKADLVNNVSNSMAPNTAFCFVLISITALLLLNRRKQYILTAQYISFITFFIAFLSFIGYLYNVQKFYGVLSYIPMAIHTAFCFLLLSLTVFFSTSDQGVMKVITSDFSGSFIARRLIPVAVMVPVILGFLRLWGHWAGILTLEMGTALLILSIIIIFFALIWFIAALLNKRDYRNKQIETSLIESEKQIQTIFKAAPDAVIVISQEGKIIKWNSKAEELFGWSFDEIEGKLLTDTIIPHRYREAHQKGLNRFLATEAGPLIGNSIELQALNKNGSEIDVALSISPTLVNDEYIFIGFIRDITEKKKAEESIRELNKELEAFTYSVSHDLRAPLRIIDGYADILITDFKEPLGDEGNRLLGIVKENARRMGTLIDELLNLSHTGRRELMKQTTDMDELVEVVVQEQLQLSRNKAIINIENLEPAFCDSGLMRQVWTNLLSNAIKYSSKEEQPVINIASSQNKDTVTYSIRDNGVGFDMKYAGKLFGVFQRLHNMSEFEGTGIGLALVNRILIKHEGRIWAEAEPDKGAVFYFSLPKI